MQLGRTGPDPRSATTLAAALRDATAARGHRPAITVLGAGAAGDRRDEQAFASLHQWVAKGAHLLEVDAGLGPGDLLALDAPPGWMAASICLAVWWVGAAVTDDRDRAAVRIGHERGARAGDDWVIGDAIDGTPTSGDSGATGAEPWALAVQAFPDQPPPSRAAADATALDVAARQATQRDLLDLARQLPGGRLGVRGGAVLWDYAVTLAARPAATGEPVVLALAATESDLAGERVTNWA